MTTYWFYARAIAVGLGAGLLAVSFNFTLHRAEQIIPTVASWEAPFGIPIWLIAMLISSLFVGAAHWLTQTVEPAAAGSGIPHMDAVLHHGRTWNWFRVLWVKFVGGSLAIGGGLALGREGPTVQMGAAIGEFLGSRPGMDEQQHRWLVGLGGGAGLAGAFNAPLAGVVFLFEELQLGLRAPLTIAALLATASADLVYRELLGAEPSFQLPRPAEVPLEYLPLFVLLGGFCGLLGVLFNFGLLGALNAFAKVSSHLQLGLAMVAGGIVGLLGCAMPDLLGSGHQLILVAVAGQLAFGHGLFLLPVRFLLTISSYALRVPGGIFTPLLVMGALSGLSFARCLEHFIIVLPPGADLALVVSGMAGVFAASIRAPLTGVVLLLEMTGSYLLVMPLLTVVLCAELTAHCLRSPAIYTALLERDLKAHPPQLKSPVSSNAAPAT